MRKLSLTYLAVLILVSGVGLARAQDSVSTEQIALIKELVETTGGKQQFNEIMSNSISLQREQYKEIFESLSTNDAGVTSAEKKLIAEMVNESLERITARSQEFFTKKFDFDKFVDNVYVPAYSKHFTTGELRDLISFYHTSTWQKMIKEMPQLMNDTMMAVSKHLLPDFTEFIKQAADEEMARIKQRLIKKKTSPKS